MNDQEPLDSDWQRHRFLDALDRHPIEVNDWEFKFIQDLKDATRFSPKQASVIDKMYAKYGKIIGYSPTQDNVPF